MTFEQKANTNLTKYKSFCLSFHTPEMFLRGPYFKELFGSVRGVVHNFHRFSFHVNEGNSRPVCVIVFVVFQNVSSFLFYLSVVFLSQKCPNVRTLDCESFCTKKKKEKELLSSNDFL